ncbi:MAG: hypothetical protein ACC700_16970 [Anaerolineales bacterium]
MVPFVVVWLLAAAACTGSEPTETPTSIVPTRIPIDDFKSAPAGTALVIRGSLTHVDDLPQDVGSWFVINTGYRNYRIITHYGEFPVCENTEPHRVSEEIPNGTVVETYGEATLGGDISTCDSPAYYVRAIDDPDD